MPKRQSKKSTQKQSDQAAAVGSLSSLFYCLAVIVCNVTTLVRSLSKSDVNDANLSYGVGVVCLFLGASFGIADKALRKSSRSDASAYLFGSGDACFIVVSAMALYFSVQEKNMYALAKEDAVPYAVPVEAGYAFFMAGAINELTKKCDFRKSLSAAGILTGLAYVTVGLSSAIMDEEKIDAQSATISAALFGGASAISYFVQLFFALVLFV